MVQTLKPPLIYVIKLDRTEIRQELLILIPNFHHFILRNWLIKHKLWEPLGRCGQKLLQSGRGLLYFSLSSRRFLIIIVSLDDILSALKQFSRLLREAAPLYLSDNETIVRNFRNNPWWSRPDDLLYRAGWQLNVLLCEVSGLGGQLEGVLLKLLPVQTDSPVTLRC